MVFQQLTTDDQWLYLEDKEKKRYEMTEIENMKRKKQQLDSDLATRIRQRKEATQRWEGHDQDEDHLDDGMEIQVGLANNQNVPQHKQIIRNGINTKGNAYVGGGSIVFDWDHSIIDLNLKQRGKTIGGVHTMREPKRMPLSVNLGSKMENFGRANIEMKGIDVKPHKYTLPDHNIKSINTMNPLKHIENMGTSKKKVVKKDGVNDLSRRLTNFLQKQETQKKKSGQKIKKPSLDFSMVGLVSTKKKKGLLELDL